MKFMVFFARMLLRSSFEGPIPTKPYHVPNLHKGEVKCLCLSGQLWYTMTVMILINSFLVKKSIISQSGFHPISSFIHTIILPKSSYPMSAFALSNYIFVQFWYRDEKEHSVRVTINDHTGSNEQEAASYALPPEDKDEKVYQETFIIPRIVVSEPQTIWICTYCDGNKVQDYPIEFLYR